MRPRLFRDQHETEHNRFIAQTARHGGWAICGETVYNFRRRFDQDRFRWACRAGREYVEGHIKGRLHPANQRSAMRGRYPGGQIHSGYIVDYDPRSPTYKHYLRYEPHAILVEREIYRYFSQLVNPSLAEVVRHWEDERLVWPFFGPEIDPRVVKVANGNRLRDESLGGYRLRWPQVESILTDVTYLGYRVRRGDYAKDADGGPLVCHEPLVDADLFWWCYDRVADERPPWPWVPARTEHIATESQIRRHAPLKTRAVRRPSGPRFLAQGRVRCVVHQKAFVIREDTRHGVFISCNGPHADYRIRSTGKCPALSPVAIEQALSESFVDQLRLDERDLAECARLIDQRDQSQSGQRETQLQRELADARARLQRALEQGLRQENADLAEELFVHAREAKALVAAREAELAALDASRPVSARAWLLAQRVDWIAQRIRATFTDWSRDAKARVFGIALDDAVLGYVNRWGLGLWMQWHGGGQSRREVRMSLGKWEPWSKEEKAALVRYYPLLTWAALCKMFPHRSQSGIGTYARILGAQRGTGPFTDMVPIVFEERTLMNTMGEYGFPLPRPTERECYLSVTASRNPGGRTHG